MGDDLIGARKLKAIIDGDIPKQRVFVALPTYDMRVHATQSMSIRNGCPPDGIAYVQERMIYSSSLLTRTFNELWLAAWRMRDKVDWFCMLHDDIQPEPGWITKLIEEAILFDAHWMAANSRIKEFSGDTSTALDLRHEGNPLLLKRVNIRHLVHMPETYNASHIAQAMNVNPKDHKGILLNTGCFVVNMRAPWYNKVAFDFNSGIAWDAKEPFTWTESEDWLMSRRLYDMGYGDKLWATSKIRLLHHGTIAYDNYFQTFQPGTQECLEAYERQTEIERQQLEMYDDANEVT